MDQKGYQSGQINKDGNQDRQTKKVRNKLFTMTNLQARHQAVCNFKALGPQVTSQTYYYIV